VNIDGIKEDLCMYNRLNIPIEQCRPSALLNLTSFLIGAEGSNGGFWPSEEPGF